LLLADAPAGATRVVDDCYDYTDADQIGEGTYGKVYRSAAAAVLRSKCMAAKLMQAQCAFG
jgi:hypothetical protein